MPEIAQNGFYKRSQYDLYLDRVQFQFMTNNQLNREIEKGIELVNKLYPPKKGMLSKLAPVLFVAAVVTIGVGAIAAGASGTAAAAGPAVSSVSASVSAATGASTAAATAATTTSSVLSTIQTTAKYLSAAGKIVQKATGKNPAEKLMKAADIVASPSMTSAGVKAVEYELQQQNLKINTKNKKAQAALAERVQREQQVQAAKMRQLAQLQAKQHGFELPQKQEKRHWLEYASLATPFLLMFFNR